MTRSLQQPVGVIGLGVMGLGLGISLRDAGIAVIGFDLGASQRDAAARVGIKIADSPSALARDCPTILFVLPNGSDVQAALAAISADAQSGALLIDCSTIAPGVSRALARQAVGSGLRFADAAMGGAAVDAASRSILFMVGTRPEDEADVIGVLTRIARQVIVCGDVGAGVTTKLINNALALTIFLADTEALLMAKRAGLDIATTQQVLAQTGASNVAMQTLGVQLLSRSLEPGFRADLALKDLRLAVELASDMGMRPPMFAATLKRYTEAVAAGLGSLNASAAGLIVEEEMGVKLHDQ